MHDQSASIDRRRDNVFKNIVIPVVIAVITGSGAAYMATTVTIAIHGTRIDRLETDILGLRDVLQQVANTNVEMARRSEWMRNTEKSMDSLLLRQRSMQDLAIDRHTRVEGSLEAIDKRIDRLEAFHK